MCPNISAESEPETRIENPVKKTVPHHPQKEIHPTARNNGTGSEGGSDTRDQSVNKCHCREHMRGRLGGTSLSSEASSQKAPAKRSGWADEAIKSFLPPTENILPVQGQENLAARNRWGHRREVAGSKGTRSDYFFITIPRE